MTQEKAEAVVEPAQAIPEPTLEELKAHLAQVERDLVSARSEAKAHQRFGQEKQSELQKQADLRADINILKADMETLAVAYATRGAVELPEGANQQDVLAELQKRRLAAETQRKQEIAAVSAREYNQRADTVYAQAQSIFGEGQEEKLEDIEDLLKAGNIARAEQRITRASKSKSSASPQTDTQKAIADGIQAELKKRGLLDSDTGSPSGGSKRTFTRTEIADYSFFQANKEAILQAQQDGRILE